MFQPDYMNIVNAALNKETARMPLYEHIISPGIMERITGKSFAHLIDGDYTDKREFFRNFCQFQCDMGYDTVSYECLTVKIMPGSGALYDNTEGVIKTRADFEEYPWRELPDYFFDSYTPFFKALREEMPEGMKAIGGVGNGIFECAQDLVGFQELCEIKYEDEALYKDIFTKVGETIYAIWERFLPEFGDIYCVCRMGDDLGFKSSTLLRPDDISELILPGYKRIVDLVHSYHKPFLLHSCGRLFDIMDELITVTGIDAKHSNEDAISPYSKWIDDYGDRIGNFGGLDTDALCEMNPCDIEAYTENAYSVCAKKGHGIAIGSGNSIPDYVSVERYVKALETIRRLRGE